MRGKEVIEQAVAPERDVESDARDLFEMANLYPGTTVLPMTVWVSPRGNARHDVRVKGRHQALQPESHRQHGGRRRPTDTAQNRRTTVARRYTNPVPRSC